MSDANSYLPIALWTAGGAAVGAVVGTGASVFGVRLDVPPTLGGLFGFLVVVGLVSAAGYGAWRLVGRFRDRGGPRASLTREPLVPPAPAPPAASSERAAAAPLACHVTFPDIPQDAPDVWGVGDALKVRVVARRGGKAAAGAVAVVALVADGARRELGRGVVGADGAADFPLVLPEPADLVLEAEVVEGAARASARRELRVVRYEDEVEGLFNAFLEWAHRSVPGCRDALTAREIADVLSPSAGATGQRALAELARIYELVAYGERTADRNLYLALLDAFEDLEKIGLFARYDKERPVEA